MKLSKLQIDAMHYLNPHLGKTVSVLTSQYDANVAQRAKDESVGTVSSAALRGLQAKGFIRIDQSYWKGATLTVLRAAAL